MSISDSKKFMRRAIELARDGMNKNEGGPFGAVIVKNGQIIGEGNNLVTSANDPTAHAEIMAIRNACKNQNTFQLANCEIYCTCEPCPMCLGAIYWARIEKIYFAANRLHAANASFDDSFIYDAFDLKTEDRSIKTYQLLEKEGQKIFDDWNVKNDRKHY